MARPLGRNQSPASSEADPSAAVSPRGPPSWEPPGEFRHTLHIRTNAGILAESPQTQLIRKNPKPCHSIGSCGDYSVGFVCEPLVSVSLGRKLFRVRTSTACDANESPYVDSLNPTSVRTADRQLCRPWRVVSMRGTRATRGADRTGIVPAYRFLRLPTIGNADLSADLFKQTMR
jgi:hypothetical protein